MGTLVDITDEANNMGEYPPNRSNVTPALKSAAQKGLGKSHSPHFMSPTVSSSKQTISPSVPLKTGKNSKEPSNAWVKLAVKRVGLRRLGDGTLRSKKEGLTKETKISFPDKVHER